MSRWFRIAIVVGALLAHPGSRAAAQNPQTVIVRGTVTVPGGAALADANVFLLETLEGAETDATGRFAIVTAFRGAATLVVRRVGFAPARIRVAVPAESSLAIVLEPDAVLLSPIRVEAGSFRAGNEANVTLTPLQVVTTPGAAADVYRAIQTFPGLQAVDEGAGLFVRGGDVSETRILVNDATVLSPYRYESPTGGTFGAFDPFLLDGIYFSSGGFGARYGDALSGIVALETQRRPGRNAWGTTLSLAAFSGSGAVALPHGLGLRATATRSNTALLFRLNGATRDFTHVPEGRDLSGSAIWEYRPGGEVKLFAIDQWSQFGVAVDAPAYSGSYDAHESHNLQVVSWHDRFGRFTPSVSLAHAGTSRTLGYGAFTLDQGQQLLQAHARSALALNGWWTVTLGGDLEQRRDDDVGSFASAAYDNRPAAPTTKFASRVAGTIRGLYGESDIQISGRSRVTLGLRSDRSSLTHGSTWDPRAAFALRVSRAATLTAAWGIYHQVPGPLLYVPTIGDTTLPAMRAVQWVLGGELKQGAFMARVEAYRKDYDHLAQTTRDGHAVGGGEGASGGADFFLKWDRGPVTGRIAYSYVRAERTDPDTRVVSRSPFDISHTATAVLERAWGAVHTGLSFHWATGRPFTPVVSSTPDTVPGVWVPAYGAPQSERLPPFVRLDLSTSWLHSFWRGNLTVLFVGVSNALDRDNLYGYQYSADYTQRIPTRSQFKRSVYVGATFQF